MKKILLIIVNIAALVATVLMSYIYTANIRHVKTEAAKQSFRETTDSMKQLTISYLSSQQNFVNGWSAYIQKHNLDEEKATIFLRDIITNDTISAQLIDSETLEGYSVRLRNGESFIRKIDYNSAEEDARQDVIDASNCNNLSWHLHFTRSFVDPVTGENVVGFCRKVTINDENNVPHPYLIMRVVPEDSIRAQWVLPMGYDHTEIALVTSDGNYVVRSTVSGSMNIENLYDFVERYNDFDYVTLNAIKQQFSHKDEGDLICKNADGVDAYFAHSLISGHSDYVLVGYMPVSMLVTDQTDWIVVFIVGGILLALLIVDIEYFLHIQKTLKKSMAEAEAASLAKTKFLSTMSHDIRTPMNAIVGMTKIAENHIDDKDHVKECLDKITLASRHLLTLINDILDISKVESGKLTLNPSMFSLAENAANLVNIMRPQIKAKMLNFDVHVLNIKNEYLFADELRVNQIFINILSNAVKYTPEGGTITVTIEQQPSPKDEHLSRIIYTVEDTGIGMTEEFMGEMFTAFTRAKDSRVDTVQGTGLGLAITKQMVDILGGTIEVQSEVHKGSTFKVTLDLPFADKVAVDFVLPPMKMLVVDDDEVFLDTAMESLKSMGVDAISANSGKKAVELALEAKEKGEGYPVIIIDWLMPFMNGIETTRRIREEVGSDASIIIISSYDSTEIEDEAKAAGANAFLNKPLFPSTIYYKMNELLHFKPDDVAEDSEDYSDLKGLNLLVAEDNDLNWEIIEELLDTYEISSKRACNGQECVEELEAAGSGKYAAVLMDVQMPIMNGYAATKAIRESKQEYAREIPIVAMTADAFAEDVKACLDAGMNGHVSKPVDMKQLLKELRKCLRVR